MKKEINKKTYDLKKSQDNKNSEEVIKANIKNVSKFNFKKSNEIIKTNNNKLTTSRVAINKKVEEFKFNLEQKTKEENKKLREETKEEEENQEIINKTRRELNYRFNSFYNFKPSVLNNMDKIKNFEFYEKGEILKTFKDDKKEGLVYYQTNNNNVNCYSLGFSFWSIYDTLNLLNNRSSVFYQNKIYFSNRVRFNYKNEKDSFNFHTDYLIKNFSSITELKEYYEKNKNKIENNINKKLEIVEKELNLYNKLFKSNSDFKKHFQEEKLYYIINNFGSSIRDNTLKDWDKKNKSNYNNELIEILKDLNLKLDFSNRFDIKVKEVL